MPGTNVRDAWSCITIDLPRYRKLGYGSRKRACSCAGSPPDFVDTLLATKDTQEFIGFVGPHTPAPELPFSPCVEVGWRLAAKHWGKGFATEAARGALRIDLPTI
ncbi:MAG TPA: GNAT family N-acetyltransferase [Porticoccaceae bacterium]|nr:GNAT family N-acetyltransferase [Porticoccaceae bacterium]